MVARALIFLFAASQAQAVEGLTFGATTGLSVNVPATGVAVEGGRRLGRWSVLGRADWNVWLSAQDGNNALKLGVLDVGIGGELRSFGDRCRSAAFTGASVLLFNTPLDDRGTVGVFVDVFPLGVRWPLADHWALRVDPISVHVLAPVLSGIPLMQLQYRHSIAIDWLG